MPKLEYDFRPVNHITIDAIGKPGKRVFFIQGRKDDEIISLIIEKIQTQTLAIGIEGFLVEISNQYPDLPEINNEYTEDEMRIKTPVDPLFRVGEFSLGYNPDLDLVVLIATQTILEDQDPEDVSKIRFWCTRSQISILAIWGIEVASRGRQLCPLCGEPLNPNEKHFCPKKNGRQH